MDLCGLLAGAKFNPILRSGTDLYSKIFPNFPQKCPILIGNYSATDIKVLDLQKDDFNKTAKENQDQSLGIFKEILSKVTTVLPNGFYKYTCRASADSEPVSFAMSFVFQFKYRMGEDSFKWNIKYE